MRLIDADALLEKIIPKNQEAQFQCVNVKDIINAPTIEAQPEQPERKPYHEVWISALRTAQSEPKTGRWMYIDDGYADYYKCDRCERISVVATNYCPNCGVRMKNER